MKLELKHLAPYLPYQVLVGDGRTPFELTEYNFTNVYPYITSLYLRPLSDLTKEIEVNGERFVPREKIAVHLFEYDFLAMVINRKNTKGIPFWVVQKLFEWHFDVFGLIEAGLAISYNDLK